MAFCTREVLLSGRSFGRYGIGKVWPSRPVATCHAPPSLGLPRTGFSALDSLDWADRTPYQRYIAKLNTVSLNSPSKKARREPTEENFLMGYDARGRF